MDNYSKAFKEPICLIIPVFNRRDTTLSCLEKLEASGDLHRYNIIVVDDASTDGTAEAVREFYPEIKVLTGNGNLWWTGGMAVGMEYAYDQGAEYFIWLNDDCVPESDTLPQLVNLMRAHPNWIVAPACYTEKQGNLVSECNGFKGRMAMTANPGEKVFVDGLSGWCVGIPRQVFSKIGPPDSTKFPHYSGDDTYIMRATRAGFKACIVGDIKVVLVGEVHANLSIAGYFKSGLSPSETFRAIFWNKKSPYRVPTKFHYHIERYGLILGLLTFLLKMAKWLGQWGYFQISIASKSFQDMAH